MAQILVVFDGAGMIPKRGGAREFIQAIGGALKVEKA
jgi:hypothetical protein